MNLDVVLNIVIVVFTVSNLAAMGLELNLRDALKTLHGFDARNVSGGMLSRAHASFFLQEGPIE